MISNFISEFWMEIAAVVFAIIYLLLAVKQDVKCWFAAIISSILYFFIMYDAGLYMEAYLQIFYIMMAFYGLQQWRSVNTDVPQFIVRTWNKRMHIKIIVLIVIMTLISGFLLEKYTNAILPFIDGLTTWGAIVATYMVAKRLLENWIYWFVIDFISIFLFMSRGLFLTSGLFFIYLVIIYFGYMSWVKIRDDISAESS
ncbi:nicotinamide riboside transporter PnuC [Gammaproteobacteria bacterium]|nr:nicotinamide riboside transporter PnuC [Gammaproteobacteria bacterium]